MRDAASLADSPQSTITRVAPDSMYSAFPVLPLPRRIKRISGPRHRGSQVTQGEHQDSTLGERLFRERALRCSHLLAEHQTASLLPSMFASAIWPSAVNARSSP